MVVKVKTPCIGVCSTGLGDSVCRGCKRFAHEVIRWNGYSDEQQQTIIDRIEQLLTPLVKIHLRIIDESQLMSALSRQNIRVDQGLNAYCHVYEAIRAFGGQLSSIQSIGCELSPEWQGRSVAELKKSLEDHFYQVSCAHYERYFPGHM